jgi:hypothetical protein
VNPGLAALAVAVVAGGIIAVSTRESRVAVLGLTLSAVTAPLIGDPLPDLLPLAVRVVAAMLAGYLLWIAVRQNPPTRGSRLGWPVESLVAVAAGIAGFGAIRFVTGADDLGDLPALLVERGPREALAAGTALAVTAAAPILVGRDVLRLGIGLSLGVLAAQLLRVGLAGNPSSLEHIVTGGLTIAVAAAVATLAAQALRSTGGLDLSPTGRGPARPRPDWHPDGEARRGPSAAPPAAGDPPPGTATDRSRPAVTPRSGVGRRSVRGR